MTKTMSARTCPICKGDHEVGRRSGMRSLTLALWLATWTPTETK